MTVTTPDQWFAYTAATVAAVAAALERYKASKATTKTDQEKAIVSEAKAWKERAELMEKMSNDYHTLLEKEYAAHQATRQFHHDKANEFQAKLDKCVERCSELQAKTDITKVETLLLQQGDSLKTMAEGIRELLVHSK